MRPLPRSGAAARRRLRRVTITACAALTAGVCATPGASRATPPGFAFLEIPGGARASAMGGAYASIAAGAEAAFWNPAGLGATQGTEITASHYELYQKLRIEQFAVAGRWFDYGVSGSVRALYSEPIEQRDDIGNLTGSFGVHDLEFALGVGGSLAPGLATGVSASLVRERIANLAAGTYAFGAGVTYEPAPWPGVRFGMSAQNLGPAATYDIDGERSAPVRLPAGVQGGVSYRVALGGGYRMVGALESRMTRGRSGVGMLGGELAGAKGAALRVGYRLDDSNSTFGVGAGYATGVLRFDYAYVPSGLDIGDTHRFSFSAQF